MPDIDARSWFFAAVFLLGAASCTKPERRFDIPAPVPITQWADKVDTLAGTFTGVTTPVQFGDTLIVVVDARERIVWKIDLVAGTRTQLGTSGDGPGEYRRVGTPARMHGDSVALVLGTLRDRFPVISVATGRGRTHSIPVASANTRSASVIAAVGEPLIMWADTVGNVYGQALNAPVKLDSATGRPVSLRFEPLDTFPVVRYGFLTGRVDTVLRMPRGVKQIPVVRNPNGSTINGLHLGPYGAFNGWHATADGRIVLADAAEYKLKLYDESRKLLGDQQITHNAIAVSKEGWDAYVKKTSNFQSPEIQQQLNAIAARSGAPPPKLPDKTYVIPPMPRTLPSLYFNEMGRHMSSNGNQLWIPVHVADPPTDAGWDIVDITTGKRVVTLTTPPRQFVVAVTNLGAYVVARDDDDVLRLLLYRHK